MLCAAEIHPAYNTQPVVRHLRLPLANILLCGSSFCNTLYNKEKVSVENYGRLLFEETTFWEKKIFQLIFITDCWKVSKLSIKSPISSCFYFRYYYFFIHFYSFSLILSSFFIVHIQSNCFNSVTDERSNWITAILDYKIANGDAPVHQS